MDAMEHQRKSDRAFLDRCLHCAILRIEAPHEANLDEPPSGCGFRIELHEPLVRHFEAAQEAYRGHDLDLAQAHLERIQEFAPKHVGTRKALEKVHQARAATDKARAAWENARAAGRWMAANEALEVWDGRGKIS